MVDINIVYQGELRSEATHGPSGTILTTDAPKDNHGKGESFSPTDLVATALGSCMLTVMGIAARTLQVDLTGTKVHVKKEMAAKPVRRIDTLTVTINVPTTLDDKKREQLTKAALNCPVYHSLHPDIKTPIEFIWA